MNVPRPGRPRSAACDLAILDAALEVFADEGYDAFTMEAVAARAGVGKATVYRRYPGKAELIVSAVSRLTSAEVPEPDTGSLRGDLSFVARHLVHLLTQTVAGRCVPQLAVALPRSRALAREHRRFVAERRAVSRRVIERAMARGDIASDIDPEVVIDLLVGPLFYRHLVSRAPLSDAYADEVVDSVVAVVAAPARADVALA
ncbi:MAG TPA: TetR/AcrR family transcriptional regulator [Acidimicrobiia bacterium]|nr:TetR/AcrR family transcriptional regulator [Acidimicrobiia bacterium]